MTFSFECFEFSDSATDKASVPGSDDDCPTSMILEYLTNFSCRWESVSLEIYAGHYEQLEAICGALPCLKGLKVTFDYRIKFHKPDRPFDFFLEAPMLERVECCAVTGQLREDLGFNMPTPMLSFPWTQLVDYQTTVPTSMADLEHLLGTRADSGKLRAMRCRIDEPNSIMSKRLLFRQASLTHLSLKFSRTGDVSQLYRLRAPSLKYLYLVFYGHDVGSCCEATLTLIERSACQLDSLGLICFADDWGKDARTNFMVQILASRHTQSLRHLLTNFISDRALLELSLPPESGGTCPALKSLTLETGENGYHIPSVTPQALNTLVRSRWALDVAIETRGAEDEVDLEENEYDEEQERWFIGLLGLTKYPEGYDRFKRWADAMRLDRDAGPLRNLLPECCRRATELHKVLDEMESYDITGQRLLWLLYVSVVTPARCRDYLD